VLLIASDTSDFESFFSSTAREIFLSTITTVIVKREDGSIFRILIFVLCFSLAIVLTFSSIGVIMSYYSWNGKDDSQASGKLLAALIALRHAGIDKNLLIDLNDPGFTFHEIADYLERNNEIGFELIESNSEDSIRYYL
jgi:hypothetical protein